MNRTFNNGIGMAIYGCMSCGSAKRASTFNNGIGMVVVVDAGNAQATAATLRAAGETVHEIGAIAARGQGAAVTLS